MSVAVFSSMLILAECILYGIGNIYLNIVLQTMPALFCYGIRSLLAFLLFLIFFGKRIFKKIKKSHIFPCLAISCTMTLSMLLGNFSLKYANPSIAGFLLSISVIFSPFFSFLILRKRNCKTIIFPIFLTVTGIYFLCGGGLDFRMGIGEISGILCSATYAMVMVLSEKYLGDIDIFTISLFQTGVGAAISLILGSFISDIRLLSGLPASDWYILIFLAVFCTFAAFYFQNFALSHITSNFASILFCTESVFTAMFGYVILGDRLNRFEICGSILILAGVIIASLRREKIDL